MTARQNANARPGGPGGEEAGRSEEHDDSPPGRRGQDGGTASFLSDVREWRRRVFRQKGLTLAQSRVAGVLGDYFNSTTREAFPATRRLADDTGLDRSDVRRALQALAGSGFLVL